MFSVLRRHAILVVVITAACVVATAFVVLRQVPQYRAAAVIRLQDERGAMTGGLGSGFDGMMVARSIDPVMSQIQVLRSRAVSTEVVERTGLRVVSRTPEFSAGRLEDVAIAESFTTDTLELVFGDGAVQVRGQRGQTSGSYGSPILLSGIQLMVSERPVVDVAELVVLTRAKGVERFLESLSATIREGTDVIDVAFTGSDPRWAQEIVNTAVEVFQTQSALAARQQAQRRREFLQEQLIQSDSALILAQVALTDFQQREGVASSQDKLLAQQVGLLGLDVRREELAADRQVLNSLLDALSDGERATARLGSLISTPEVAANPVVSGLFSQLVRLEASRDSLTQGDWGSAETHPDVQRLNLMIGGIRDRLVESVTNHTQTLDARVAALDDLKARNLAELQSLPASGAEEVRLVQQVEAVGKIADQLREEYQRARISEAVETGQVEIIDPAVVPSEPIGSGRALKLVLGLMLGLAAGVRSFRLLGADETDGERVVEEYGALVLQRHGSPPFNEDDLKLAGRWANVLGETQSLAFELRLAKLSLVQFTRAFVQGFEAQEFSQLGHAERVTAYALALGRALEERGFIRRRSWKLLAQLSADRDAHRPVPGDGPLPEAPAGAAAGKADKDSEAKQIKAEMGLISVVQRQRMLKKGRFELQPQFGITVTSLILGFLAQPAIAPILEPALEPLVGETAVGGLALERRSATQRE